MAAVIAANKRIGRFDLVRELGRGAQGTVFLAHDTRLDRPVALKTLHADGGAFQSDDRVRMLLEEARLISRLQHPNIVTLFDAGEEAGVPYLVFEYVEGRPLSRFPGEGASLSLPRIVDIIIGVLRGLAFAHDKQVLHRDIKPANIMLTEQGVPRIMDFGIACHAAAGTASDNALYGTPAYMAPEYVRTQSYSPASDVYAAGVMLYELLTGAPPVCGPNVFEVLHKISSENFPPPSDKNPEVDERLDAIVMRVLEKRPEDRYASAQEMAQALIDYLAPAALPSGPAGGEAAGTLEFLLRRIRYKSDFPALGSTIGAINRITASDREPISVLCDVILKDVALASKLLKIVNAATYSQFGGAIGTVSRAVAILGYDAVRTLATSLLLFDHMQNKAQAAVLKEEMAATYFSAVAGEQLVHALGMHEAEEVFLCTMFHRLGRLLVTFYLHEDKQAIDGLAHSRNWEEDRAAQQILGLSYADIGMGVARRWNFPEAIVTSMRPLAEGTVLAAIFRAEPMRVVSALATRLVDLVRSAADEERSACLDELVRQFGPATGVTQDNLLEAICASAQTLQRDAHMLGAQVMKSRVIEQAQRWCETAAADDSSGLDPTAAIMAQTRLLQAPSAELLEAGGKPSAENRQAVLAAGVQDITNTLVGEYALNDVLRIILETMYRGMGFQRMLIFVRDPPRNVLSARFGFGAGVDAIVRSGFSIPLEASRDVFHAALGKGADICIDDIDGEKIRDYVPRWYRDVIQARSMVLFPVRVREQPVALIYGDADSPDCMRFKPDELSLLKTLRNQAVLAVRQKI